MLIILNFPTLSLYVRNNSSPKSNGASGGVLVGFLGLSRNFLGGSMISSLNCTGGGSMRSSKFLANCLTLVLGFGICFRMAHLPTRGGAIGF